MRIFLSTTVITLALLSAPANAQRSGDRAGTWEAGFHVADASSVHVDGSRGTALDVDSELGYGLTGAYNITNRLAVGLNLNWVAPDYRATFVPDGGGPPQTFDARLDVSTIHAKVIFNLLEGGFTPYVEVGAGWTYIDSNIADGPPTSGCWWDPWWGYVCTSFYDTYSDTQTSYSAALGVRWEISSDFVLRGSYGVVEINADNSENVQLDTLQVDFGWRF